MCLFRVVQESLRNVSKHSGAREAHVDLSEKDKEIVLLVEDAGRGFDMKSNRARAALGLISMRERVPLVGGEIFGGVGTRERNTNPGKNSVRQRSHRHAGGRPGQDLERQLQARHGAFLGQVQSDAIVAAVVVDDQPTA